MKVESRNYKVEKEESVTKEFTKEQMAIYRIYQAPFKTEIKKVAKIQGIKITEQFANVASHNLACIVAWQETEK